MHAKQRTQDLGGLLAIASIIAVGGLIYELLLGTASSYLFGDSIVSFSLSIGLTLFGMGLGSLLSKRFLKNAELRFVQNELILSVLGASSIIVLFAAFNYSPFYWLVYIIWSIAIGICIGLEIPLVLRIAKTNYSRESSNFLGNLLAIDYIGALIGSLLFPFILLPKLGLIRTSIAVALLNTLVVIYLSRKQRRVIPDWLRSASLLVGIVLVGAFIMASRIERILTSSSFQDQVVFYKLTPYQRIVLTQFKDDTRLYLNNNLQFSSRDEARYHESLAHAAMTSARTINDVLILGGGDGLLAREVLEYPEVNSVTIVDLDPAMTDLAKEHRLLTSVNQDSLRNPKVTIINQDAFTFIRAADRAYDVILSDLVDPSNEKTAKLYSQEFYTATRRALKTGGAFITQSSSTYFTPRVFWTIYNSMLPTYTQVAPLSVNVPSFGEWGFLLATDEPLFAARRLPQSEIYITDQTLSELRTLPPETAKLQQHVHDRSTLIRPTIHTIYNQDMSQWSY